VQYGEELQQRDHQGIERPQNLWRIQVQQLTIDYHQPALKQQKLHVFSLQGHIERINPKIP
jgi:hypothetical protein